MCKLPTPISVRARCSLYLLYVMCYGSSQRFLPTSGRTVLESSGAPAAPIFLTGIQVDVHKAQEQPPAPQTNHFDSYVKPHDVIVGVAGDDAMECGSGKRVM